MPNPPEPDPTEAAEDTETTEIATVGADTPDAAAVEADDATTQAIDVPEPAGSAPAVDSTDAGEITDVIKTSAPTAAPEPTPPAQPERRFTAPGFDAGQTEVMPTMSEADTALIAGQPSPGAGKAAPRQISGRFGGRLPATTSRSWGWVMALILIILGLAVVAVLGTLWLTRDSRDAASQEDHVRETVQNFDVAVQNGDLAALRTLTCGDIRDRYDNYDQNAWNDTYRRISAAKQFPVIASIDQVVVDNGHAEVNVTAFMAYEPRVRSTRSLDLQFRDDQWKICQSRS